MALGLEKQWQLQRRVIHFSQMGLESKLQIPFLIVHK
jgi:hypothetical protein